MTPGGKGDKLVPSRSPIELGPPPPLCAASFTGAAVRPRTGARMSIADSAEAAGAFFPSSARERRRRHVERDFTKRTLRNIWSRWADHSSLMPANLITLAHFSVSSAISLLKSAGEPTSGVPPRSASLAFILRSPRPVDLLVKLVDDLGWRVFGH